MTAPKLAVLSFIASEAVFFTLLVLAYVFLHGAGGGPRAAGTLDPGQTAIFTVALVASSGTFWAGERRLRRGGRGAFVVLLAATIVLAAVFLAGQGAEWARLLRAGVAPRVNPFATAFFTLTGFHGLHVAVGIVLLAVCGWLGAGAPARTGVAAGRAAAVVESAGLYWHFVDAVWIGIFLVVYVGSAW